VTDLEPITPRSAVDRFLQRRRTDSTDETVKSYRYRLKQFVEWAESAKILNMNDVTGRRVQEFAEYRKQDLNENTLKNELGTLKKFTEFCVAIEAVEPALPDKVQSLKPSCRKSRSRTT